MTIYFPTLSNKQYESFDEVFHDKKIHKMKPNAAKLPREPFQSPLL